MPFSHPLSDELRVSQAGDFADAGEGLVDREALNLAGLNFLHAAGDFSLPGRFGFRVADAQIFGYTTTISRPFPAANGGFLQRFVPALSAWMFRI